MDLNLVQTLIVDFQKRPLPDLTERNLPLTFVKDMSLAVVGSRRCGKTYRTYQFIEQYLRRDGDVENVCRIQFNDHRLSRLGREDLSVIDEAYYALFPEKRGKTTVYFVFDEIHRVEGWEDYILSLLEEPTHRVLLTGSTSRLLTGEIASALRGKNLSVSLYPFSFSEFIRHYEVPRDVVSSTGQSHLRNMLDRYLRQGGFPGLLDLDENLHLEMLQTYWDAMVLRDIIEAHADEQITYAVFSYFAQAMISRVGCPVTVRGIMRNMEEAGLRFTGETIYKYLRFLEEAFMVFVVPIFTRSEKVRNRNYHKAYAIDWALADAISPGEGIDVTRRFENMVYIELKRRGYEVYYYRTRGGHEIDFIAVRKAGRERSKHIYQVCYKIDTSDVRERELRGIPETARHFGENKATIITLNEEETLDCGDVTVAVIPAWKWLLQTGD